MTQRHPDYERGSAAITRNSFVGLLALAGAVCLLPRQWVSAIILFALSALLLAYHLWRIRRADPMSSARPG